MNEVWKKIKRLFLIIGGVILLVFFIGLFSLKEVDDRNVEDNQKYKVMVSHGAGEYVFYCQEYLYKPGLLGDVIVLVDWKGNTTNEIIVTESMYVRTSLNPEYNLLLLMEKFKEDVEREKLRREKEAEAEIEAIKKSA